MRFRVLALVMVAAACAGCASTGGNQPARPTVETSSQVSPSSTTSSDVPADPLPAPTARTLVALGDSFASGVGARGMIPTCGRSPQGWTGLLANELGMNFVNLACSGATLPETIAQVEDLPEDVDVVAVTTGGNSLKFSEAVILCLSGSCETGWKSALASLPVIRPAALELLTSVHRSRPDVSAIVLSLYPAPTQAGRTCGKVTEDVADLFARGPAVLNAELRAAAEDARDLGVPVVVVEPVEFSGHVLCSAEPWFYGPEKGLLMLHLNDEGYAAMAGAARAALLDAAT